MVSNICTQKRGVSIAAWNTRGLVASIPYLKELMKSNDLIAISEHWLHANRLNVLDEIDDEFNVIARASRYSPADDYGLRRGQGGVAMLWRKSLVGVSPLTELVHDRICGVSVHTSEGVNINIYSIYMPASCSSDNYDEVLDEIAEIINSNNDGTLSILCGDFNADLGYLGGPRSNKQPTKTGKKVIDFFREFALTASNMQQYAIGPVNTFSGGMGTSAIDFIAIPEFLNDKAIRCEVIKDDVMNTSDHRVVKLQLGIDCSEATISRQRENSRVKWNKIRSNILEQDYTIPVNETILGILNTTNWEECDNDEIDTIIDNVTKQMVVCSNRLPKSRYRKHIRPFWNENLTVLKREKVKYHRIWKNNGCPRDDGDQSWVDYKRTKKRFRSEIKYVQCQYEKREMEEILNSAEFDKNRFWRKIKNARKTNNCNASSIRNAGVKVVQETKEIVEVWRKHFSRLCTETDDDNFDRNHYQMIKDQVSDWADQRDDGPFLEHPFSSLEIKDAIKNLNKGKSPGHDSVTTEHLQNAGVMIYDLLAGLFNRMTQIEYVPRNFRTGTQIPLFKGKNLCALDPNNYRGITLLTSLNKVFEIVIWGRMKAWWKEQNVISPLQGACRPGSSCVHSALILQESIAAGLDTKKKVFVAYFDVAKAFDSVWIDGLFYHLHVKGVVGRVWRMLYATYQDFKCRVRVNGEYSDWYSMTCGIHQGGFLSLLKYIAFIDPLLRKLEESDTVCSVVGIPTSPVGYADDMATCSISKTKLDKALNIVGEHAKRWRYRYNAKKSAIMVYGENRAELKKGTKYRNLKIGSDKVKESTEYDHVGIKNCLFNNFMPRTEDRIRKGRRAFNAITCVGIRKRGLSMKVCARLFWSIIVPILTYGSEIWVLIKGGRNGSP